MNPVLRKDVLGLLRLRRMAATHSLFLIVLGVVVLMNWPQQGVVALATRGRDSLLLGLILGQLILLTLIVPGIAGVALSSERESNTLEMLYGSRLSPLQIIVGKVGAAIAFPMLLLITGLPFTGLLAFRGEVDWNRLLLCYLILLLSAVLLGIMCLTISAYARQSATALVLSYVTALLVSAALLVPAAIMLKGQSGVAAQVLHYSRSLSPLAAVLSLLRPSLAELGGRSPLAVPSQATGDSGEMVQLQLLVEQPTALLPAWQVFIPLAIGVIVLCMALLSARLARPPSTVESGYEFQRQAHRRKALHLIDEAKQRPPIGGMNPVFAKEFRTSPLRSARWMIRVFYAALVLSLLLAVMALYGGIDHPDLLAYVAAVIVSFQFALVALIVPSLTSAAISGELETGSFEMLRLTRLGGGQIFWGKLLPAFVPALLPIIAMIPAYAAICVIDQSYLPSFLRMLPVIIAAVLTCCTIGLTCSSFLATTARATVCSYIAAAALFVLPLLAWLASGSQIHPSLGRWIAAASPAAVGLDLLPSPEAIPLLAGMWSQHLVLILFLCMAMLLLSRLRLAQLIRRG